MILTNNEHTVLWDLELWKIICEHQNPDSHTVIWKTHPQYPELLLLIRNGMQVQTYYWKSLEVLGKPKTLAADGCLPQETEVKWAATSSSSQNICAILGGSHSKDTYSNICVYPFELLLNEDDTIKPDTAYAELATTIKVAIGAFKSLLLFLNHEDWVCSLNIDTLSRAKTYTKHFYIPQQWRGSGATMQILVTKRGSVVLVSVDELAIFHDGLDFEEHLDMPTTAPGKGNAASSKLLERPAFKKGISSPI